MSAPSITLCMCIIHPSGREEPELFFIRGEAGDIYIFWGDFIFW